MKVPGQEPSALDNSKQTFPTDFDELDEFLEDDEPLTPVEIEAGRWIMKMTDRLCPDEDWREFRQWLAQDQEHVDSYANLIEVWGNPNFDLAWKLRKAELDARAHLATRWDDRAEQAKLALFHRCVAVGFVLVMSTLIGSIVWLIETDPFRTATRQREWVQTAVGEQRSIQLADGTQVHLNTNTEIQVAMAYHKRQITVTRGEIFLDVAKERRKFLVIGGSGLVSVTGTAFEVKVNDDGDMAVAVERGRVAVSPKHNAGDYVMLTPQQRVEVIQSNLGAVSESVEPVADWRDGQLEFVGKPFEEVVAELSKYYSGDLRLHLTNEKLLRKPIDGKFYIRNIPKHLKELAIGMRLNYIVSDTGDITLSESGESTKVEDQSVLL